MGFCVKLIVLGHLLGAASVGLLFWGVLTDRFPPMPDVPEVPEKWFGPGKRVKESTAIEPFKIKVEDKVLEDLRHRIQLDLTRLAPPLEDSAFNYGFNTNYLKEVGQYWLDKYDWRKEEAALNKFPQFTTQIDGLKVHFIHAKPDPVQAKGKKVIPMLIVHGWPGSVVEFKKIIPMLTTPREGQDFVFEVIAPSIPGFGYSSASAKMGFNAKHCARIFKHLMERLGHKKFYAQGGDWGSFITTNIGILYPESLLGLHINMVTARNPAHNLMHFLAAWLPSGWVVGKEEEGHILPFAEKFADTLLESGYLHIQATKPDTVGVGLSTSPLGLAAYILEKFSTGTNKAYRDLDDGGITKRLSLDDLLTNLMMYWAPNSITSAKRIYKEVINFSEEMDVMDRLPVFVPTGLAVLPNEIVGSPKAMAATKFKDIVTYTRLAEGGHFAALEVPKLLFQDFVQFVKQVETGSTQQKTKQEL